MDFKQWLTAYNFPPATTSEELQGFFPFLTLEEITAGTDEQAFDLNKTRQQAGNNPKPAPVPTPIPSPMPDNNPLAPLLAYLQANTQPTIKPEQISAIVDERVKQALANHTRKIEVVLPSGNTVKIGAAHNKFETVLKLLPLGNLYLYGPAGTGKSFIAEQAAEALGLSFYCEGVGPQSSQVTFKGYKDVNGNYVSTQFRQAWENGGVFCLDEVDAGNPSILLSLNMARAKKSFAFADGIIPCHKDFYLICTANTFGTGATREYVGRNQLDAAFLDGFFNIEVDYDKQLEIDLYGNAAKTIHNWRQSLKGERVILSIRSISRLYSLIAAGFNESEACNIVAENIPANLRSRIS